MGLWHTNGSPNLRQKTKLIIINKKTKKIKTRICKVIDFAVPDDRSIKLKESEKKDKYFDFAKELGKLGNMKVTIIPIVNGAFGTLSKGVLTGLENLDVVGRRETSQTTAVLRTALILSPGALRRLPVSQNPVNDHQQTLMWKTQMCK